MQYKRSTSLTQEGSDGLVATPTSSTTNQICNEYNNDETSKTGANNDGNQVGHVAVVLTRINCNN